MKICTIEGCETKVQSRGLCATHYSRWYLATGGIHSAPCKVEQCDNRASANSSHGMCRKHYDAARYIPAPAKVARTCSEDGCTERHSCRGFCRKHYTRWQKYGDPRRNHSGAGRAVDHEDGTRTCLKCEQRFPLDTDHFYRDNKASSGYRSRCISCYRSANNDWYSSHKDQVAAYAEKNKAHIKARNRKRYADNRERLLPIMSAHTHLRRKRIAESNPVQGITIPALRERHGDCCCYCGIQMTFAAARKREYIPTKATLEHVIPVSRDGRHDWHNTRLCCWECNTRKNNKTAEEWLAKVGWMPFDPTVLDIEAIAA